jgi:hypothetical protein
MKTKRSKAKIGVGQKRRSAICSDPEQKLEVLRPDAAGIDCGAEEHYIAVPPDRVRAGEPTVRCFSAFTEGLDAAVDWLKACRISTVAMDQRESIGLPCTRSWKQPASKCIWLTPVMFGMCRDARRMCGTANGCVNCTASGC